MNRQTMKYLAILLCGLVAFTGCHPTQPFYLHEDGDLSHYLDKATELEFPDVERAHLAEVEFADSPFTLSRPEFREFWDLSLEECVITAMKNSKMIRDVNLIANGPQLTPSGTRGLVDSRNRTTAYEAAITETQPRFGSQPLPPGQLFSQGTLENQGVEAALSEFDAQIRSSVTWDKRDRPQNRIAGSSFLPSTIVEDVGAFNFELSKKAATGNQFFARMVTNYNRGNSGGGVQPFPTPGGQALSSFWTQALEIEGRHPLLAGRGTQINRIPVVVARTNADISLARLETDFRKLVMDIEVLYWDLYAAYRILEANKQGRDETLNTWKKVYAFASQREVPESEEANAREQYFFFRSQVERSLADLYNAENNLRYLMGLGPTDGRLIRPIDEPALAKVDFDWHQIRDEALIRRPELRQQKWEIKRRELELIYARNQLLPQLNLTTLYRWLGSGDELGGGTRNGVNFPDQGSRALDNLTEGDFQEFSLGLSLEMPVGFRNELSRVRQVQLQLARENAVLEDMELEVTHQLTLALRALDLNYLQSQTNFNRWLATQAEVQSRTAQLDLPREGGGARRVSTFFELLNAQRRNADAQTSYFRSISEYNKEIADVHYRKGSLLEYNNIYMSEGPWPDKAYWDAHGEARRRDASYYLDYGWSRPGVISQGPVPQAAPSDALMEAPAEIIDSGEAIGPEAEDVPAPTPAQPDAAPQRDDLPGPVTRRVRPSLNEPSVMLRSPADKSVSAGKPGAAAAAASVQPASFNDPAPAPTGPVLSPAGQSR